MAKIPKKESFDLDFNETQDVVVLVHGIFSKGIWMEKFAPLGKNAKLVLLPFRYNSRFPIWLWFKPLRKKFSRMFSRFFLEAQKEFGSHHRYHLIAHSFGTHLSMEALSKNSDIIFENIVLSGSILPENFPFHWYSSQFGQIKNEMAEFDLVVRVGSYLTPLVGRSGWKGFNSKIRNHLKNRLLQTKLKNFRHCDFFGKEHMEKWIPFIKESHS